jgi:hypothetical protein
MVKIVTKSEAFKTLQKWTQSDGPSSQAYYLLTLQEAMDVQLDRDALIIIRCPEPTGQDA